MIDVDPVDVLSRLREERLQLEIDRRRSPEAIVAIKPQDTSPLEVGMTPEGLVALTIAASNSRLVFPIELRMIRVTVLRNAQVVRSSGVSHEDMILVICRSGDELLMQWFLRVGLSLLGPVISVDDPSALSAAIMRLAQLFELATLPGLKTIVGLWGELLVLCSGRDAKQLARAWRSADEEPFDFALENERLEVKASLSSANLHFFSVRQLRPDDVRAWIVSVPVQRQGSGSSIHDLAAELRQRVLSDVDLIAKIDRVLIEGLGVDYSAASQECFDRNHARNGMRLYPAESIPCVETPLPDGITSARLNVDLSYAAPIAPEHLPSEAFLARAIFG